MRFPVGEILADSGDLTIRRLRRASEWQKTHGGTIERALLATGAVTEEVLTTALARATGFPAATRSELLGADLQVVTLLPRSARRRLRALPYGRGDGWLLVAASDPLNPVLETGLITSTGQEVKIAVVPEPVLDDCLTHWEQLDGEGAPLGGEVEEEEGEPESPFDRLARALLKEALHHEATELELGLDSRGGYARSRHPRHPEVTRRVPAAVMPFVIAWFRRMPAEGFTIDWASLEELPRRIRASASGTPAGGVRVTFGLAPAAAKAPEPKRRPAESCRHERAEPGDIFCPNCGQGL